MLPISRVANDQCITQRERREQSYLLSIVLRFTHSDKQNKPKGYWILNNRCVGHVMYNSNYKVCVFLCVYVYMFSRAEQTFGVIIAWSQSSHITNKTLNISSSILFKRNIIQNNRRCKIIVHYWSKYRLHKGIWFILCVCKTMLTWINLTLIFK